MAVDQQQMIQEYRQAVRQGVTARWVVIVLLIGVVLFNVRSVHNDAKDFLANGWEEFGDALTTELANTAPLWKEQAAGMAERVVPVYADAISTSFEQQSPALEREMRRELAQLEAHAQARWPEIERAVADLAISQEEIIRDGLNSVLTEGEAENVSEMYGEALIGEMNSLLQGRLMAHVDVSREIGENLHTMLAAAPAQPGPVDRQELLGVMLELAGLQLQQTL